MNHASLTTLESMNQALWYNRWTLGKFSRYLKADILEVGCGIGNFTPAITVYGRVWAIDRDSHAVSATRKRVKDALVGRGNIENGTYFFKNKRFSSIVCLNVLEHIQKDSQALANMQTLLLPSGYLILLTPIYPMLYGTIDHAIGHYRRYNPSSLLKEVEHHGFHVVSTRKLNLYGAIGWFITGRLLKRTSVNQSYIRLFNYFSPILLPLEDIVAPPFGTSLLIIAQKTKPSPRRVSPNPIRTLAGTYRKTIR